MSFPRYIWQGIQNAATKRYLCHYCGANVASDKGWFASTHISNRQAFVFVCPNCSKATFFDADDEQTPSPRFGREVKGISDAGVVKLYDEARDCTSVGAYTGAVLLCRKLLMNIAVQHGAPPGKSFLEYVDHLSQAGFVPPNGRAWVDEIRKKGNEATHEIHAQTSADAIQILTFIEMLLRFVYEFPAMLIEPTRL